MTTPGPYEHVGAYTPENVARVAAPEPITPTNAGIYLVQDLRYPNEAPELARFVAYTNPRYDSWQFFGTDDDAHAKDIEIVADVEITAL